MTTATIPSPTCPESSDRGSVASRASTASPPSTPTQTEEGPRPAARGSVTVMTVPPHRSGNVTAVPVSPDMQQFLRMSPGEYRVGRGRPAHAREDLGIALAPAGGLHYMARAHGQSGLAATAGGTAEPGEDDVAVAPAQRRTGRPAVLVGAARPVVVQPPVVRSQRVDPTSRPGSAEVC